MPNLITVQISGEFLRELLDIPGGVKITGAMVNEDGDLYLGAASDRFKPREGRAAKLIIRTLRDRRGGQFSVVLWPDHEKSTLDDYGLQADPI